MTSPDTKGTGKKKPKYFLIQPMMINVVVGLVPCLLGAVYFFGWRALLVAGVATLFGVLAEAAFTLRQNKPVTSAVFVTSLIFALSLPPTIPLWMVGVGIVFGVVFGKMAFGGFGFNIYNPAMVGRAFIYITFPVHMTSQWVHPISGGAAGFARFQSVDAVTTATPLVLFQKGGTVDPISLFLGTTSGSLGETSILLILLGGAYIIYKKSASWRLCASAIVGGIIASLFLLINGVEGVPSPLASLLSGSFLFGAFFIVTEPISGPKTNPGRLIYGFLIGALIIVLRRFSNFAEGVMFSVLFMNTFVPILDMAVRSSKKKLAKKSS